MNRSGIGFEPTPNSEEWEANVSALLDGELDRDNALETVDRLLLNPELQRFYREGRLLQKELDWTTNEDFKSVALPAGLWKRIEKKSRAPQPTVFGLPASSFRWLAAASFILFLTVTVSKIDLMGVMSHIVRLESKGPIQIELGEGNPNMTEDRFMAMTAELLRSDKRFHWKMLEILQQVTDPRPNADRTPKQKETASTIQDAADKRPALGS